METLGAAIYGGNRLDHPALVRGKPDDRLQAIWCLRPIKEPAIEAIYIDVRVGQHAAFRFLQWRSMTCLVSSGSRIDQRRANGQASDRRIRWNHKPNRSSQKQFVLACAVPILHITLSPERKSEREGVMPHVIRKIERPAASDHRGHRAVYVRNPSRGSGAVRCLGVPDQADLQRHDRLRTSAVTARCHPGDNIMLQLAISIAQSGRCPGHFDRGIRRTRLFRRGPRDLVSGARDRRFDYR